MISLLRSDESGVESARTEFEARTLHYLNEIDVSLKRLLDEARYLRVLEDMKSEAGGRRGGLFEPLLRPDC